MCCVIDVKFKLEKTEPSITKTGPGKDSAVRRSASWAIGAERMT